MPVEKLLLSKKESAAALGISVRSVENFIRRKELPARKLGRRTLIPLTALQQFARRDHETRSVGDSDVA
jgi:excisionase family DNA binding protein